MNARPIFAEEERAAQLRKLSAGLCDAIREAFRPIGRDRLAYETARTRPADEIEELLTDLRRVESENSNHPRRL